MSPAWGKALIPDDTLSSLVSPRARDLWGKQAGVLQLGSGTLDYVAWPHPHPGPLALKDLADQARDSVSASLVPEIPALASVWGHRRSGGPGPGQDAGPAHRAPRFLLPAVLTISYLSQMTKEQMLVMYSGYLLGLFPRSHGAPRLGITNGMVGPGVAGQPGAPTPTYPLFPQAQLCSQPPVHPSFPGDFQLPQDRT